MTTLLIVCDKIQEINRIRRNFDVDRYIIKATGAMQSAAYIAATSSPSAIIYQLGEDYTQFFTFYRQIRETRETKDIPLLLVADISIMKPFSDHIYLENSTLVSSGIQKEAMSRTIEDMINKRVMGTRY